MAGKAQTREVYDALVAAFREQPGNGSAAARTVGIEARAALRAWHKGWPRFEWGRPIKDVIADEQAAARTAQLRAVDERRDQVDKEREQRRSLAVAAYREEGEMIARMRGNVLIGVTLVRHLVTIGAHVLKDLAEDVGTKGALKDLTPLQKVVLGNSVARSADMLSRACTVVTELDRKHYGDPTVAVGDPDDKLTPQQAAEELAALRRSLDRAEELGLAVLEGGTKSGT